MKQKLLCLSLLVYSLFAMDSSDEEAQKKALAYFSGRIKSALGTDIGSSSDKVPPLRVSLDQIQVLPQEWKKKLEGLQNPNLVWQLARANKKLRFPVEEQEYLSEVDSTIGQWGSSSDERSEDLKSIKAEYSPQSGSLLRSDSQNSLDSISSTKSLQALSTPQRDIIKKKMNQLMAESLEKYNEKQQGKILLGKRITITAVVVLALALCVNFAELIVIVTEAVFSCTGD